MSADERTFRFQHTEPSLDVSVIIPVRNEIRHIDTCIESVLRQRLTGMTMELILVDGQSDDGTTERLRDWSRRDPRIRVLENPARRVSPALNLGMSASRGKVIVRLDAHAEYADDYIAQSLRVLRESGASAVGGIQVPMSGADTRVARAIAAIQSSRLGMGGGEHRRLGYEGTTGSVWLGAFPRKVAEGVGGFDETLFRTEDNDFYQRVRAHDGRLWTSHSIRARYYCRATYSALARQYYVTGTEICPTLVRNHRALALRHLTPGVVLTVGAGLVIGALLAGSPGRRWFLACLATLGATYTVLLAGTASRIARESAGTGFWEVLVAFPVVHGSYAIGTLVGVLGTLREFLRKDNRFRASRRMPRR